MANTTNVDHDAGDVSGMDLPEHERSYSLFVALVKWSTISIAIVLVLLYFIVRPGG